MILSDSVLVSLITAGFAALTTIGVAILGYQTAKLNKQAANAATMVAEVKTNLEDANAVVDTKLNEIGSVGRSVHVLVNSNMGIQLKISAISQRRLAILTKDKDDIVAAELAEKLSREHEEKQATLDRANGIS